MNVLHAFMRPPTLRLDQFPTPEEAASNITRTPDTMLAGLEGEMLSLLTVPQSDEVQRRLSELVALGKREQTLRQMAGEMGLGALWAGGHREGWGKGRRGLWVWRTPDGPYWHSGKWYYAPCPDAPRGVGPCASEYAAMADLHKLALGSPDTLGKGARDVIELDGYPAMPLTGCCEARGKGMVRRINEIVSVYVRRVCACGLQVPPDEEWDALGLRGCPRCGAVWPERCWMREPNDRGADIIVWEDWRDGASPAAARLRAQKIDSP